MNRSSSQHGQHIQVLLGYKHTRFSYMSAGVSVLEMKQMWKNLRLTPEAARNSRCHKTLKLARRRRSDCDVLAFAAKKRRV